MNHHTPTTTMRHHDTDWLEAKYTDEWLPKAEIARQAGVDESTIRRALNRFGITRESNHVRPHRDAVWLYEMHHERRLTQAEMARKAGVTQQWISQRLAGEGILPRRATGGTSHE